MSDTPRTDAEFEYVKYGSVDFKSHSEEIAAFARQLERELNAANERIKRLEEAGNDLAWWFCQINPSQLSSAQTSALNRWRGLRGRRNP